MAQTTDQLIVFLQVAAKTMKRDASKRLLNLAAGAIIAYREWIAKRIYELDCERSGYVALNWCSVDEPSKNKWRKLAEEEVSRQWPDSTGTGNCDYCSAPMPANDVYEADGAHICHKCAGVDA